MQNTDANLKQLSELRKLGVAIAMDDFGTGYSSLGYLWQFRLDKLKIDRSFVAALNHHDKKARDILDTIIMLGHKLEMTVTAEGIETAAPSRSSVCAGLRPCAGLSIWSSDTGQRNCAVPAEQHAQSPVAPKKESERKPAVA